MASSEIKVSESAEEEEVHRLLRVACLMKKPLMKKREKKTSILPASLRLICPSEEFSDVELIRRKIDNLLEETIVRNDGDDIEVQCDSEREEALNECVYAAHKLTETAKDLKKKLDHGNFVGIRERGEKLQKKPLRKTDDKSFNIDLDDEVLFEIRKAAKDIENHNHMNDLVSSMNDLFGSLPSNMKSLQQDICS